MCPRHFEEVNLIQVSPLLFFEIVDRSAEWWPRNIHQGVLILSCRIGELTRGEGEFGRGYPPKELGYQLGQVVGIAAILGSVFFTGSDNASCPIGRDCIIGPNRNDD